jgi:hypothetical protein
MKTRRFKQPQICQTQHLTSYEDCEQAIMREAVDKIDEFQKQNKLQNGPEIKKIMGIVEDFIRNKGLVLYGGQAINSILPRYAQFYNETDIPDYDFFTTNSPKDARELADIFYAAGYRDVEAKSGVHKGTQKVFVSNIPVADLTQQDPIIFAALQSDAIIIDGVHYAPANWLRMGMYLELCRTFGDTSRFSKVLKRLTLLNKYYPLKTPPKCHTIQFQRAAASSTDSERVYDIVRDTFINQDVVFFGGYALSLFSRYMPRDQQKIIQKISDFDVLSVDADKTGRIVVEQLKQGGFTGARAISHPFVGEVLPKHVEIRIGNETLAFIYQPEECVNYNEVSIDDVAKIRVATIDTILRYYLAFLYTNRPYFDTERLLCMANFLYRVQEENRLNQRGMLQRFTTNCIGEQHTLEDVRAEKSAEYERLKNKRNDPEYEQWFLKYTPGDKKAADGATPVVAAEPAVVATEPEEEPVLKASKKTQPPVATPRVRKAKKTRRKRRRARAPRDDYLF